MSVSHKTMRAYSWATTHHIHSATRLADRRRRSPTNTPTHLYDLTTIRPANKHVTLSIVGKVRFPTDVTFHRTRNLSYNIL